MGGEEGQSRPPCRTSTAPTLTGDALSFSQLLTLRQPALSILYPLRHSLAPASVSTLVSSTEDSLRIHLQNLSAGCKVLEPYVDDPLSDDGDDRSERNVVLRQSQFSHEQLKHLGIQRVYIAGLLAVLQSFAQQHLAQLAHETSSILDRPEGGGGKRRKLDDPFSSTSTPDLDSLLSAHEHGKHTWSDLYDSVYSNDARCGGEIVVAQVKPFLHAQFAFVTCAYASSTFCLSRSVGDGERGLDAAKAVFSPSSYDVWVLSFDKESLPWGVKSEDWPAGMGDMEPEDLVKGVIRACIERVRVAVELPELVGGVEAVLSTVKETIKGLLELPEWASRSDGDDGDVEEDDEEEERDRIKLAEGEKQRLPFRRPHHLRHRRRPSRGYCSAFQPLVLLHLSLRSLPLLLPVFPSFSSALSLDSARSTDDDGLERACLTTAIYRERRDGILPMKWKRNEDDEKGWKEGGETNGKKTMGGGSDRELREITICERMVVSPGRRREKEEDQLGNRQPNNIILPKLDLLVLSLLQTRYVPLQPLPVRRNGKRAENRTDKGKSDRSLREKNPPHPRRRRSSLRQLDVRTVELIVRVEGGLDVLEATERGGLGEFLTENVGTDNGGGGSHPAQRRGTRRSVTDENDPTSMPLVDLDLRHLLRVKVFGRLKVPQNPVDLPSSTTVQLRPHGLLFRRRRARLSQLEELGLGVAIGFGEDEGGEGCGRFIGGGRGGAHPDTATVSRRPPAGPRTVSRLEGDREVGGKGVHRLEDDVLLVEDEGAGLRAESIGENDDVEGLLLAALEGDDGLLRRRLVDGGNRVAEAVLGPFLRNIVEDLGQSMPDDLVLVCRTETDGEGRNNLVVRIDEMRSFLARRRRSNRRFEAHGFDDLASDALDADDEGASGRCVRTRFEGEHEEKSRNEVSSAKRTSGKIEGVRTRGSVPLSGSNSPSQRGRDGSRL